ncbi:MAG: sugar transferase [Candidatus Yanofskybacteria bacterium]|nr:sugar transferase [Candidatus Yanofskybacteria bacterium]
MVKRLTLIAADLVAFYGALAAVLLARYGSAQWSARWAVHVVPFSMLLALWLVSLYIANLYERRIMRNDRDFFSRLGQAIIIASIASVLFFYLVPGFGIAPKTNLFFFLIAFTLLITGARSAYNGIIAGGTKKRILIIGINPESIELARLIQKNPQLGYHLFACVRLGQESLQLSDEPMPWGVIDNLDGIGHLIASKNIDTVVISPAAYEMSDVVALLYDTLQQRVDFMSLASLTERLTGRVPLGAIDQAWFLENITEGSKKRLSTAKRIMDIAAAVVLGVPTLLLTPFIAAAIRLDSPGPILFRQRRTGRGGIPFDIIKFRTMRTDAEKGGAQWAATNDPRVTRVGRFLRKTRIDELPQLINILNGQMSLVGPRAERPEFDQQLAAQIPFYRERYLIKPGLSGWAQINYPYGASVTDAIQKLQYDLYYLKHRSLALDIEIVLKTVSIALRREGK